MIKFTPLPLPFKPHPLAHLASERHEEPFSYFLGEFCSWISTNQRVENEPLTHPLFRAEASAAEAVEDDVDADAARSYAEYEDDNK